jgi:hypothetical protein
VADLPTSSSTPRRSRVARNPPRPRHRDPQRVLIQDNVELQGPPAAPSARRNRHRPHSSSRSTATK